MDNMTLKIHINMKWKEKTCGNNVFRKIMQDYLHEVLNGKKWIKLKTPKIKNFQ